jgi:hypothetical protein
METSKLILALVIVLIILYIYWTCACKQESEQILEPEQKETFTPDNDFVPSRLAFYILAKKLILSNEQELEQIYSSNLLLEDNSTYSTGTRDRGASGAGYIATNANDYASLVDVDRIKRYLEKKEKDGKLSKKDHQWILQNGIDAARYTRAFRSNIMGILSAAIAIINLELEAEDTKTLFIAADGIASLCVSGLHNKEFYTSYTSLGRHIKLDKQLSDEIKAIQANPEYVKRVSKAADRAFYKIFQFDQKQRVDDDTLFGIIETSQY